MFFPALCLISPDKFSPMFAWRLVRCCSAACASGIGGVLACGCIQYWPFCSVSQVVLNNPGFSCTLFQANFVCSLRLETYIPPRSVVDACYNDSLVCTGTLSATIFFSPTPILIFCSRGQLFSHLLSPFLFALTF